MSDDRPFLPPVPDRPEGVPTPPPAAGWSAYAVSPPSSGKATASLVLGICGLVVCPLVCSVLALVFGLQARKEIDRSGGAVGGRGLAQAGVVLGWVGIGLSALGIALVVLLLAFGSWETTTFGEETFQVIRGAR